MISVESLVLVAVASLMCLLLFSMEPAYAEDEKPTASEPPLRLACRIANYGAYQDAAFGHIKKMGLKYVFMSVPKPEEVEETLAQLAEHELEVLVVRGNTNLSTEESVTELAEQITTCKRLGVRYMFLSPKHNDTPKEEVFDRLRRAGDIAAEHDVFIVLETHPDLGTNGDVHVATMRAINHPNIRANFDTGNITFYNHDTDAVSELKKCMDYVVTVEVKDHNGEFESWSFPALGEGVIDFPAFFRVLREHNYAGPVTLEVEGIKGVEWTLADIKKAMEDSVAYLRSIESFR